MTVVKEFTKDPNAVLDYGFDWSDWLTTGETISTSTWIVPSGITQDSESESTELTTIWLSGGTARERYDVTNRIVSSAGRTDDRTLRILVANR
jgi:hypothetical protein